jgi:glycosyltransferase involved in cell wall biosynthesis
MYGINMPDTPFTSVDATIRLSIVIPTYNEERRLAHRLTAAWQYIERRHLQAEIVVSDDGSIDRTVKFAAATMAGMSHQLLTSGANRGKGAALRRGMLAAYGVNILLASSLRVVVDVDALWSRALRVRKYGEFRLIGL